jgi:hypothetical protein
MPLRELHIRTSCSLANDCGLCHAQLCQRTVRVSNVARLPRPAATEFCISHVEFCEVRPQGPQCLPDANLTSKPHSQRMLFECSPKSSLTRKLNFISSSLRRDHPDHATAPVARQLSRCSSREQVGRLARTLLAATAHSVSSMSCRTRSQRACLRPLACDNLPGCIDLLEA